MDEPEILGYFIESIYNSELKNRLPLKNDFYKFKNKFIKVYNKQKLTDDKLQIKKLKNEIIQIKKQNIILKKKLYKLLRYKPSELKIGMKVLYMDKNTNKLVECKIIHIDNTIIQGEEPYYTIQFTNGNERQTEITYLYPINM
tara:strand:+ start:566 stop:994 length:429 start_codon:yes stop_codon:yes gene_type:complete